MVYPIMVSILLQYHLLLEVFHENDDNIISYLIVKDPFVLNKEKSQRHISPFFGIHINTIDVLCKISFEALEN